jgi:Phage tail assembly chaperone protein, TAC
MSRTFGAGAVQLAGLAGRLLGWRPDEFWCATPAELAAILSPPADPAANNLGAPSRAQIQALMEADHERSDRYPAD